MIIFCVASRLCCCPLCVLDCAGRLVQKKLLLLKARKVGMNVNIPWVLIGVWQFWSFLVWIELISIQGCGVESESVRLVPRSFCILLSWQKCLPFAHWTGMIGQLGWCRANKAHLRNFLVYFVLSLTFWNAFSSDLKSRETCTKDHKGYMAVVCSERLLAHVPRCATMCHDVPRCATMCQGAGDDVLVPRDFARRSPEILRAPIPKTQWRASPDLSPPEILQHGKLMEIEYIKKHKDDVKSWNHCFICFTCFTFMFCLKSTQTKKLDSHWDLMRRQRRAIETAPTDSSPTMSNFAKSKEHLESGEKQFEDVRGVSFNIHVDFSI